MTPKQQIIFRTIRHYIFKHGYAPTEQEIATKTGVKSRSAIHRQLKELAGLGFIEMIPHKRRGIRLNKMKEYFPLPIIGRIAAGNPIESLETPNVLDLADLIVGQNRYVLQVKGNSMSGDNICDGDYIICERRDHAENGEIAIVLINGKEATLKRIQQNSNNTVTLLPSNPKVEPMIYNTEEIEIQGVYLGLIRLKDYQL